MHFNARFCIIVIFNKLDTKVFPLYEHNNLGVNKKKNYIVKLMFLYRIYVLLYLK